MDKDRGRAPVKRARPDKPRRSPLRETSAFDGERIAKVMARAGLCSRRDAEEWVRAGRVAINGALLSDPAVNVTERDRVTVDGQPLAAREKTRLFLFNKPRGLVTTDHDPEGRPTVFAYLAHHHPELPRLVSVGRLDITTEGLLLLTNDGGLARVLELPATGWLRRYRVRAHGQTTPDAVDALKKGVTIEGVEYQPIDATLDRVQGANTWLTIALREGKNREVRRVLEHLGLEVNRLIRLSYGPFQLGDAPDGAAEEVRTRVLMDQLGPALIAESGADFSTLRREEERAHQQAQDAAAAPPQKRERPAAGKRKHVSTMRNERDDVRGRGPRVRIERAATEDRRGRTVAVEHVKSARPKPDDTSTRNGRRFRDERVPPRERTQRETRRDGSSSVPFRSREDRPSRATPREERPARPPRRDERPRSDMRDAAPARFDKGRPPRREGAAPDRTDARRGPRAFSGKPGAGKAWGAKSGGDQPSRGRPATGRPGGNKPGGSRPGKGKPFDNRPGGKR